jgi:ABC-type branched-subunit amino acid transport system ATPase component/ABC-type branched-subunit amino acid transport system permease subunit
MIGYLSALLAYFLDDAIWIIGLNLQMGITGILNVGYVLFFGLGAYLASVVTMGSPNTPLIQALSEQYVLGMSLPFPFPWIFALVVCGILALIIGLIILRRIGGEYLAIATFATAQICWVLVANNASLFNGYKGLINIPRPWSDNLSNSQSTWLFLLIELGFFLLTFWFAQSISHAPFGRTLRAIRENEHAAAALGKNVFLMRLTIFVCGSCISALAGALLAEYITVWDPSAWTYNETFVAIAALIVGGRGNNWGAVLGALLVPVTFFEAVQYLPAINNNAEVTAALQWISIGILIIVCLWFRPQGFLPERPTRWAFLKEKSAGDVVNVSTPGDDVSSDGTNDSGKKDIPALQTVSEQPYSESKSVPVSERKEASSCDLTEVLEGTSNATDEEYLLMCQDVRYTFGGVQALNGASLNVQKGSITALIGPNGAGKSTLFNIIAGAIAPESGNIQFDKKNVTGLPAHRIAGQGIVRTFQKTSEFPRLTVLENMMVAPQHQAGEHLWAALFRRKYWKQEEKQLLERAYELLKRFDLDQFANNYASTLSGGQKRLLELARALMGSPQLLLLDEPMTGISPVIVDRLVDLLLSLNADGTTLLIVEHDLAMVERLCSKVFVMAQGKVLTGGTLQDVRKDQEVIDAYLK